MLEGAWSRACSPEPRTALGKSLADGKVEVALRRDRQKHLVPVVEAVPRVMELPPRCLAATVIPRYVTASHRPPSVRGQRARPADGGLVRLGRALVRAGGRFFRAGSRSGAPRCRPRCPGLGASLLTVDSVAGGEIEEMDVIVFSYQSRRRVLCWTSDLWQSGVTQG
jgi:hypothetical protein